MSKGAQVPGVSLGCKGRVRERRRGRWKDGSPREEAGASSRGKAGGIWGRRGRQRGLEAGGRDPRGELTFAQQSSRSGSVRSHKSLH